MSIRSLVGGLLTPAHSLIQAVRARLTLVHVPMAIAAALLVGAIVLVRCS